MEVGKKKAMKKYAIYSLQLLLNVPVWASCVAGIGVFACVVWVASKRGAHKVTRWAFDALQYCENWAAQTARNIKLGPSQWANY